MAFDVDLLPEYWRVTSEIRDSGVAGAMQIHERAFEQVLGIPASDWYVALREKLNDRMAK